jgi:hypothetical protein
MVGFGVQCEIRSGPSVQHDVCALTPLDSFQQSRRDAHLRHNSGRQAHRLRPLPRKLRHPAHRSRAEVRLGEGLARVAVRFRDESVPEPGELK